MTSLADEILSVALGLERGDSVPAAAGRKLREIAERVREMPAMHECASCGFCYEAWQDGGDNCPVCSEYRLLERIAELKGKCQVCDGAAGFVSHGDGFEEWDDCEACFGTGRRDTAIALLKRRIAELEKQLRLNRDGWHKIPPYGYVPDEAQAPYVAGPVAEEPE